MSNGLESNRLYRTAEVEKFLFEAMKNAGVIILEDVVTALDEMFIARQKHKLSDIPNTAKAKKEHAKETLELLNEIREYFLSIRNTIDAQELGDDTPKLVV